MKELSTPPSSPVVWRAWTGTRDLGLVELGCIEAKLWYAAREEARRRAAPLGIEAVERAEVDRAIAP